MTTEMVTLKSSVQELEINVDNINTKVNKQDREMEGMLKKMKEVGSKLETALDAMDKVKEGNESITQIAGTETTTIEVTTLVEQKITEIRNEQEDKRQRENKMIFFGIKEDENLEAKQRAAEDRVILIELFEIMKTKEEILSITRLGR